MSEQSTELVVKVDNEQLLQEVTFNYDQLKTGLSERLKKYNELVVTEDAIKSAKGDRANLNKLDKALGDKGTEIKQRLLGGFDVKLSELRNMVKTASGSIDKQVKTFEQQEKDKKKAEIQAIYTANIAELVSLLPFDKVFNEKMLNVTSAMSKIEEEVKAKIETVRKDIQVIDTLKSDFALQIKDVYLRTMDLSLALSEKARLEKVQADIQAIAQKPKVQEVVEPVRPVIQQEVKEEVPLLKATFTVIGTREQLSAVREFLINNKIQYEGAK